MSSYTFKKWQDGFYIDETDNVTSVPLFSTIPPVIDFTPSSTISEVNISAATKILFEELIDFFKVKEIEPELFTILVHLQDTYISFEEAYRDPMISEFTDENRDYNNLLNILEEYFFNPNNALKNISINFGKDPDVKISPIKSKSVMEDVLKSICRNLNITKENFFDTKSLILAENKHISHGKGGEYIRHEVINELHQYIKTIKKDDADTKIFKFIGCFLHICQIPAYSTIDSIQIDSVKEEFDSIEVAKMRHYLKRPRKIFTK